MAQTHPAGRVLGQRPDCVFGSLSKQLGAPPAVLCKHVGPDPERSEEFSPPGFTAGLAAAAANHFNSQLHCRDVSE